MTTPFRAEDSLRKGSARVQAGVAPRMRSQETYVSLTQPRAVYLPSPALSNRKAAAATRAPRARANELLTRRLGLYDAEYLLIANPWGRDFGTSVLWGASPG